MVQLIADHAAELQELCRRFHVLRLDVFGSVTDARRFGPDSDLDFLVEFQPAFESQIADDFFSLLSGLQELFGRHVDLITESALDNPHFRDSVKESREPVYAA